MNETLSILEKLRKFTFGESSYEHMIYKTRPSRGQIAVRALIVHSDPHRVGAERIEHNLLQTFPTILAGADLECKKIIIHGAFADVEAQLCDELDLDCMGDLNSYSFIITVGLWESQIVHSIREVCGISIPQFYCIPGVPMSFDLPLTTRRRNCPLSGVFSRSTDSQYYLDMVQAIAPHVRTVCFLIDDCNDLSDDDFTHSAEREALDRRFQLAGIQVTRHYWSVASPRLIELEQQAVKVDAFVLFNEPTTHAHIEHIRAIAKDYQVMICAAELDSVFDGASIGAGETWALFTGPLLSQIADIVLFQNMRLSAPICLPKRVRLRYNFVAMAEQGVKVSRAVRTLLEMKSIYDTDAVEL